jgi:GGDEF domain-containing protein
MLGEVGERRLAQDRPSCIASFDGLMGLPNRSLFRDPPAQAIEHALRSGWNSDTGPMTPMSMATLDDAQVRIGGLLE